MTHLVVPFVTQASDTMLTLERIITAGDGITLTDNGAGGTLVITAGTSPAPIQAQGSFSLISGTVTVIDDGNNNSFPSLARLADGTLFLVYRVGTTHSTSKGVIVKRTSTDGGATWSAASTIITDATYDVRDPGVTLLSSGRLIIAYKMTNHTIPASIADGARVIYSDDDGVTWSAEITINSALTSYSGCSARIVEKNGTLYLPIFGKNTGDTYESVSVFTSTDDGETWGGEVTVANGETDSKNYQEPNILALSNGQLLCLLRSDSSPASANRIRSSVSNDSGLSWEATTELFAGYGRPSCAQLSNGMIIVIYRDVSDLQADYRTSSDGGVTWADAVALSTGAGVQMTYAGIIEYSTGLIGIAWSDEDADTNADVFYRRSYLTLEGGQLVSTVPTGIAPIVVASTTVVTNLNADQLDGHEWSEVPQDLDDLGDVTSASPTTGDVLYWNGALWVDVDPNTLITRAWGSMYQDDVATVITVSATDTDYIITGMSQGVLNGTTFDNGQELTITIAGVYKIDWSVSFRCASANQEIEGAVGVNGVREPATSSHQKVLTGSDDVTIGGTGLLNLAVSDLVQIVIRNETSAANVTIDHANLSLVYLGPSTDNNSLLLESGDNLLLESGDLLLLE